MLVIEAALALSTLFVFAVPAILSSILLLALVLFARVVPIANALPPTVVLLNERVVSTIVTVWVLRTLPVLKGALAAKVV